MNIEELERELKEVKAEAYDLNVNYTKLTQKISDIENEINNLKNNSKEDVTQETNETVVELPPKEENKEDSVELPQVEETPVEEVKEEAVIPLPVVEEKPVRKMSSLFADRSVAEQPVQTETVAPQNEEINLQPLIQPEETPVAPVEEKKEETKVEDVVSAVPNVQGLEPLTPVGVEATTVEENKPVENVQYIKTDANAPRAILINELQAGKLKKSKDQNKSIVFNSTPAVVTPIVPTTEQSVQENTTESKEDINKQLESMIEQLKVTTDEAEAAKLNNDINVLSKKLGQAA